MNVRNTPTRDKWSGGRSGTGGQNNVSPEAHVGVFWCRGPVHPRDPKVLRIDPAVISARDLLVVWVNGLAVEALIVRPRYFDGEHVAGRRTCLQRGADVDIKVLVRT